MPRDRTFGSVQLWAPGPGAHVAPSRLHFPKKETQMKQFDAEIQSNRRSFLKKGALAGGAVAIGAGLMSSDARAFDHDGDDRLTPGDAAILRFALAAELIEADLWTQYAELGGIGNNPPIEVAPNQMMNTYQMA